MPDQSNDLECPQISRHFVGSAFEDKLYQTDNNEREKACALKIMRSPQFYALTNDSFWWRAVGIPLNLVSNSLEGDIDLLFAMRSVKVEDDKPNFRKIYRSFELKTSKVSRDGDVKSLKEGKFHKTKAQLEKLCRIGSQQTFLLEAFILEIGYSGKAQEMPPLVKETIGRKFESIGRADYGYVALALDQAPDAPEEQGGMLWPAATIKTAKTSELKYPFKSVMVTIENYIDEIGGVGFNPVITYCFLCRKLTHVYSRGPYLCEKCGEPLV